MLAGLALVARLKRRAVSSPCSCSSASSAPWPWPVPSFQAASVLYGRGLDSGPAPRPLPRRPHSNNAADHDVSGKSGGTRTDDLRPDFNGALLIPFLLGECGKFSAPHNLDRAGRTRAILPRRCCDLSIGRRGRDRYLFRCAPSNRSTAGKCRYGGDCHEHVQFHLNPSCQKVTCDGNQADKPVVVYGENRDMGRY